MSECRQCDHPLEKGIHTCERDPFNTEMDYLRARIAELEYQLAETGDALLREDKRTREARRKAQDECVDAILNGSQFFLAGIEPEMREAVIRRALNLNP